MSSPDSAVNRTSGRSGRRSGQNQQPLTQLASLDTPNNTNTDPQGDRTSRRSDGANATTRGQPNRPNPSTRTTSSNHRQIDPEAVSLLESYLDYVDQPEQDNGREPELNELFSNQIFHASSRYKGPKVSDGYEELVSSQHPLQVIYPDRFNTTGLAYSATSFSMRETHNPTTIKKKTKFCCCIPLPDRDYDPMVMYSSENPQLFELYRYKVTHVALWVIGILTLAMAVLLLLISPFDFDSYSYFLHDSTIGFDVCNIVTCSLGLLILVLGMITKNPKIVLVFIIVFAVDAFINLLRLYSVLQFLYFLLQLVLIFVSNFYRMLISPQWYYSL